MHIHETAQSPAVEETPVQEIRPAHEPHEIHSSVDQKLLPPAVTWQWEHRTGFKNYSEHLSERIEKAYQDGCSKVRVRAGTAMTHPMEIFFADMLQIDSVTQNQRPIRRIGPDGIWRRLLRNVRQVRHAIDLGEPWRMTYAKHIERGSPTGALASRDPFQYYSERTTFGIIVRSTWFQVLSFGAILLNAIWIGIDAEINKAPTIYTASDLVQTVENLFCCFFTFELAARFLAYRSKVSCLFDPWFIFDTLLLAMMIGETWLLPLYMFIKGKDGKNAAGKGGWSILRMGRMMRLARFSRIARLLRMVPDVVVLLKGFTEALKSVLYTFLTLMCMVYVFAIIFKTQSMGDAELEAIFPSVSQAMWVLVLQGVLMDGPTEVLDKIKKNSFPLAGTFLIFIILSNFTLLNMLLGILCDKISSVSDKEGAEATNARFRDQLMDLLVVYDRDGNGKLPCDEFDVFVTNPEMRALLRRHCVNANLQQLKHGLYEKGPSSGENELLFEEFVQVVLRLKDDHAASVSDLADLRYYGRTRLQELEKYILRDLSNKSKANSRMALGDCNSQQLDKIRELCKDIDSRLSQIVARQDQWHEAFASQHDTLQEDVYAMHKELQHLRLKTKINQAA